MAEHNQFDLTGLRCPMPIVELNRLLKEIAVGDEFVVCANDPAFLLDVEAWCNKVGCVIMEKKDIDGNQVVCIRKAA